MRLRSMGENRNYLALFTERELTTALALMGTPENAGMVARAIYGMPVEEQKHYEWIDTSVHLLACSSPELAERIERDFFSEASEAQREAFRAGVEEMRRSVRAHRALSLPPLPYEVYGVIYDTRQPEGQPEDIVWADGE